MKQTIFSKDEYWLGLIAECKKSGLSQAKFCEGRGLSKSTFCQWISYFNTKDKENKNSEVKIEKEIKVKSDLVLVKLSDKNSQPFRIIFASGVSLEFSQTPEPMWISEMMRLIS